MKPAIEIADARVFLGDCREVLRQLPDNSVDSVVTDPPYELNFMQRKWDNTGVAYDVTVWQECLRVLKPGGHVLAFGGSRTWHRLAVAIEDAGFELRDSIAWLYGSGFPKSLDVSKAIDKNNGETGRKLKFTRWMRTSGLKVSEATKVLREAGLISENGTMAGHFFAESNAGQPAIPTAELWAVLRPHCGVVPDWVDELVARVEAEREVIGQKMSGIADKNEKARHTIGASKAVEVDITAPATSEAKKWQGWGTALKPAFEPVVVGRKPLVGTVAENVLAWGVGGLNIDGSRIGTNPGYKYRADKNGTTFHGKQGERIEQTAEKAGKEFLESTQGRWPANVILDEVTAGLLDEQSGVSKSTPSEKKSVTHAEDIYGKGLGNWSGSPHNDSGGASRFFYVAKASKRDRNEGLEELEVIEAKRTMSGGEDTRGRPIPTNRNFHPTVKPTQLMRYLIKLVTPLGGTVLDPFTGSGSTGKAALLDGFQFIGAELTEEYLPIIEGRLRWASEQVEDEDDTLF